MRISDWSSDVCSSDLDVLGNAAERIDSEAQPVLRVVGETRALDVGQRGRRIVAVAECGQLPGHVLLVKPEGPHRVDAVDPGGGEVAVVARSEEHTSELQYLMRTSYAVICLKNTKSRVPNTEIK